MPHDRWAPLKNWEGSRGIIFCGEGWNGTRTAGKIVLMGMPDSLLIAYAKAMLAAQAFEGSLGALHIIAKYMSDWKSNNTPPSTDQMSAIFNGLDKMSLRKVYKQIKKNAYLIGMKDKLYPKPLYDLCEKLIDIRDYLAHAFMRTLFLYPKHDYQAIEQSLADYEEYFRMARPSIDKVCDMLLGAIGITKDDMNKIKEKMFPFPDKSKEDNVRHIIDTIDKLSGE